MLDEVPESMKVTGKNFVNQKGPWKQNIHLLEKRCLITCHLEKNDAEDPIL